MTDEMRVRAIVTAILLSKPAVQIDFTLGFIHVDSVGLASVVGAMYTKMAGFPGIGIRFGNVPAGAAAAYDEADDVFDFPSATFGLTPVERIYILHESVHAMHDIAIGTLCMPGGRGCIFTTRTENEATAYVAGALFSLYDTGVIPDGVSNSGDHWVKAFEIANSIRNVKGAVVPAADATSLRQLIADRGSYKSAGVTMWSPTTANGLK
jgi:hypothetical protein